ncbi:hypothetical protein NDU88_003633 [Pleurodeles waltl]|uniref:Uncharacterized protein n=1 Tax=Pleurodeles waltl TaxID=8319 RepID=A0AAV7T584_PLEWA|nr:hypothetical protein NDU88_003633 [Pleurodeles waltl]
MRSSADRKFEAEKTPRRRGALRTSSSGTLRTWGRQLPLGPPARHGWEFAATTRDPWPGALRVRVERGGDHPRMRAESLACRGDVENLNDRPP